MNRTNKATQALTAIFKSTVPCIPRQSTI